ncbi:hypothetical protein M0805_007757 [Coniferiporia weirii]|nr:hypothetical protein M0805_007757 [Coniferiporia weirii]
MSSEAPPMTHVTTKYEDIPPRFRKLWIKGNAERVQKKLNAPIGDFSFSKPLQQSNSELNLSRGPENRTSRSHSLGAYASTSSSSSSSIPLQKRPRIEGAETLETSDYRSGDGTVSGGLLDKENTKEQSPLPPIAYNGSPAMQRIIDSVVDENVARTTPPSSRCVSPAENPNSKYRALSRSRPTSRPNSPNSGASSSMPTGWSALTSRHSLRRFDIRPWGPRHLEYDYNEARKEFQGAAYFALGQYGYVPPKGIVKYKAPPSYALPSMNDLREVPAFRKACRRLDAADRALEEAIARGETWDNTPIPKEYFQFSLEDLSTDDICTGRPDNARGQDRSRSSVTLEEAATGISGSHPAESSSLSRSSTLIMDVGQDRIQVASSTSFISGKGQMATIVSKVNPSESTTSFSQLNLSRDASFNNRASRLVVRPPASVTIAAIKNRIRAARLGLSSDVRPAQVVRKRMLEEIDDDSDADNGMHTDTSSLSPPPTRVGSPAPLPPESGRTSPAPHTRAASKSTSASSLSGRASPARRTRSASKSASVSASSSDVHKSTRGSRASTPLSRASSSARARRPGVSRR